MFKWTTLVWTGLACCLTLPALTAGTDMGCLPPPPSQDYLKKTVHVEIKGMLVHVEDWLEGPRDPQFPTPNIAIIDYWQMTVGGKTYTLDFGPRIEYARDRVRPLIAMPVWKDLYGQAGKLVGKTVIVTGTLDGTTVHVTGLRADGEYVKKSTGVDVRGRLKMDLVRCGPSSRVWSAIVDDQAYSLDFADATLLPTAETLIGKSVLIAGVLNGDTITVQSLKAAQ